MPRFRLLVVLALLAVSAMAEGQARRRAASPAPLPDTSTVQGWLAVNAPRLISIEPYPWSYDLEPLGRMIGDATIVGLGDGTHGTHEFFTVKHRIVQYLMREKQFDVLVFEAPFTLWNRLNHYVQTGEGDPAAILRDADLRVGYYFWNTEEILAVVEWMRRYNLTRGSKPAVEIAGADIFDSQEEAASVVAYLRGLDDAFAAEAQAKYHCLTGFDTNGSCKAQVTDMHDRLAARRDELVPRTSARSFDDAVRAAYVVVQRFNGSANAPRDLSMAQNASWLRQHRGTSRKMILWAHQEHLGETEYDRTNITLGMRMAEEVGADAYFAIGNLAGGGTFLQYERKDGVSVLGTGAYRAVPPESYEAKIMESGAPFLLVPLEGELPSWLSASASYRWAGSSELTSGDDLVNSESLAAKLDAVIWVASTTPARMLPR